MSKKSKIILGIAIPLVLIAIICVCILLNSGKMNIFNSSQNVEEQNIDEKVIEIGQKGYVSGVQVIQAKTGTGPWDENDNPGNDTSADNDIVRSYDQVGWTLDVTMSLKDGVSDAGLSGGRINVEASLPENLAGMVMWDLYSMTWLENGQVSDDGTKVTGSYSMDESKQTVPGKQTLVFVLSVGGLSNETVIEPTFTLNLEGNDEDEKASTQSSQVKVSSAPKYDISIDNLNMTYDIDRDGNYKKLYKYGLAFKVLGDNNSKGLKGIEIPKDELSFDIKYNMQRKPIDGDSYTNITQNLSLYNYKYNDYSEKGLGDSENTLSDLLENFMVSAGSYPYSSGGDSRNTVYKNGNLTMVDDNNGTIHVTITDFEVGQGFPITSDWSTYNISYEVGYVSVGLFYMAVDMNEETMMANTQSYMEYEAENFKVTTIGDDVCTQEVKTDNNIITENFIAGGEGEFGKETYYTQNTVDLGNPSGNGNGKAYIGAERLEISTRITNAISNPKAYWIYDIDILTKIDDKNVEPTLRDGQEYIANGIYGTSDMTFNILYGAKKDKTGWSSDEEMINAKIEDLLYFDTLDELKNAGYTCVATLAESQSGTVKSGVELFLRIPIKIKEDAKVGTVAQALNDVRIYTEYNQVDRRTQTHILTTDADDYPTPTWTQENLPYVKTQYDNNGQMIIGTHSGSYPYGNSLLILGAAQSISIESLDENNNEKTNFDIGKNENIVKYELSPEISNPSSTVESGDVTIKVQATLSKGLEYAIGTCEYEEPEIVYNDDGTTTLTWYIDNCHINEDITPIRFKANIDNDSENGQSYDITAVISEVIGEDGVTKLGNSDVDDRTAENYITITNLESHRAYKEVEEPVIEENGDIHYKVVYENKTDGVVSAFQLLDILPYNGDSRNTDYEGTYTVEKIEILQTVDDIEQDNSNLELYTTNSDNVKSMNATNTGIGTDSIWTNETIGETLDKELTGIALKGSLEGKTKVEINITLNTNGNNAGDVYGNNAMVQVYTDSEQVVTGRVETSVVNRIISGKVWEDTNKNGIIDNNESGIEGVTLKLFNSDNDRELATTTSDMNGEYSFEELEKGNYLVEIEFNEEDYYLTEKEVGNEDDLNSKFNIDTNLTDEITALNNPIIMNINEDNINAGLIGVPYNITTEVIGTGGTISGQNDDIYEVVDKAGTSVKDIIATPDYGYKVSYIEVNGERIEFTENDDHTVLLDKFTNMMEDKNIVVAFERLEGEVIVHHYIYGTTDKVPAIDGSGVEDEIISGYVGDNYTTQIAQNISESYEFISVTGNTEGKITEETTTVIYYYDTKEAKITENTITKDGTTSIVSRDDKVIYNIVYEATIDIYRGEAELYIEDKLPYEIYEGDSNLDGGTYDSETKTIKWYIELGEIDTLETGTNVSEIIRVEKNIEVLYKDINIFQDSMVNEVSGVLYLPQEDKQVEVENSHSTNIEVEGNVIVKYVDKYTDEEIETRVTKSGRVGTEFDVSGDIKEIEGYTIVEEPAVKTGTYTEEEQEKIYYYAKNTSVHVTYVDKATNEEIAKEETINGYEKQSYNTEKKVIEGYTYVEDTGNTTGEMTRDRIEVVYYYLYNTRVVVEHIDEYTNELLATETEEGLVGDVYESSAKDFEGYVLVEEPEEKTVTMTREEIVLRYYYSYISGGVIEKHIDEITGEVLDEEVHEGKEGDPYSTSEKEFTGYDLVEEKYPVNREGTMERDVIEVKYYYIKRASVRVEYIDEITGDKLTEDVVINGHENDSYETEGKEFEGYDLVEIPSNARGEMTVTVNEDGTYNTETIVHYGYKYVSSGVIERHIDNETGEVLAEETYTGYEGDSYITYEKEFPGYKVVEEKYPENAEGKMTKDLIEVNYYYAKQTFVRVKYVDRFTGNELTEDIVIKGDAGDAYVTEQKEFEGYDFIEVVGNTEGTIALEATYVTYYYAKPAIVITRHIDSETGEDLAMAETILGHEGDEYITAPVDLEYYKVSELPDNATGIMEDVVYVTYYYKKKTVDFSIDKVISNLRINGESQKISDKNLLKAEVYRKSINNTAIRVVFDITVTNEGEIAGKATILEKIPENLNMSEEDNQGWTISGDEARYETEELAPGESKTYKVVMTWKNGDGNFGTLRNIAEIESIETESGYEESNVKNNSDDAELIVTVSTGIEKVSMIVVIALIYILAIVYMNRKIVIMKDKSNKKE